MSEVQKLRGYELDDLVAFLEWEGRSRPEINAALLKWIGIDAQKLKEERFKISRRRCACVLGGCICRELGNI